MTNETARREIESLDYYLQNHTDDYSEESHTAMMMAVKALEQEPKTGHWIDTGSESFEFHRVYKCSECGNTEIEYPERICRHFRYCPNCGAKMESEE